MPKYILEPKSTKSIIEIDIWTNSSNEIVKTSNYWRWYEIIITCAEKPVIEVDCENGINILEYFKEEYARGDLNYTLNDCYISAIHEYPANMRRKRKERIDDLLDEENDLSEDGWDIIDNEIWIYTEFNIRECV